MVEKRAGQGAELRWLGVRPVFVLVSLLGIGLLSCAARAPWPSLSTPQVPPSAQPPVAAAAADADVAEPTYELARGSIRLMTTLKSTLQIDAYVPKGLPEVEEYAGDLADLLAAYQRGSKGKLKFRLIEPTTPALRQQAKENGLIEQPFASDNAHNGAAIAQGFLGLVFKYGDKKVVIPQLPHEQSDDLEFWISNKIREIRDEADEIKRRIGVVTGKDELKLSDANLLPNQAEGKRPSIQAILQQAFPFYQIEEVGLGTDRSPIDPALVGLIITQPQKDYTAAELRRIDDARQ